MFGALAEFERSLIRERTQAGPAAARRVGRTGGPSAETDGRRHRGRQGDAGQSRRRRDPNRAPPRRLSRDALSLHPRRANCEYLRRLRTPALTPEAGGRGRVRGVSLSVGIGGVKRTFAADFRACWLVVPPAPSPRCGARADLSVSRSISALVALPQPMLGQFVSAPPAPKQAARWTR
jgi:hypothetical protein